MMNWTVAVMLSGKVDDEDEPIDHQLPAISQSETKD